ncbi:MAG: pseudouridine synthase [Pseudomonadales bacterium]|nr:pseudouridine synthase [Pseudomonadales bacterium]MCP5356544.1 pseudouridine synthase [Pseudomonadales bacterium]
MSLERNRLDRFLSARLGINRRAVKPLLAAGRVSVDGVTARDCDLPVTAFSTIRLDAEVLQQRTARYLMLHKPAGLLSATSDPRQNTVLSLLPADERVGLHLAGRLDKFSTGLLLLSDDSRWTGTSAAPGAGIEKSYLVGVRDPIVPEAVDAFAAGMYFPFEDIHTQPAGLEILEPCLARVTLREGRYHQIKRMFGRFRNPVLSLHRERIGDLRLDPALSPGQYRPLTTEEAQSAVQCAAVGACPDPKATGAGA